MIFKSIIYTKPYSIEGFGTYMQEKAQVEIILEEGDTVQSCFIEAERQLDEWHDGRKAEKLLFMPQNAAGDTFVTTLPREPGKEYHGINNGQFIVPAGMPKEINLQDEQIEIDIDNCTDLVELGKLKDQCKTPSLISHYMNKLKELTK
jgi:hypothetical protein